MLSKHYEVMAERVTRRLTGEFGPNLLGVLLAGSVARNMPAARSDLDLVGVITHDWRQRRAWEEDGILVELFLNPAERLRRELAMPEAPATLRMFTEGRILFDPSGIVADICREARKLWRQGRPPPAEDAIAEIRYRVTDLLADAEDLAELDPAGCAFVTNAVVAAIVDAHYQLSGYWGNKPKYMVSELRSRSPVVARMVEAVTEATPRDAAQRCQMLRRLAEEVLRPAGGLLSGWETRPQSLLPDGSVPDGSH